MKADENKKSLSNTYDLNRKPESITNEQLQQMGADAEKELEEFLKEKTRTQEISEKI